MRVAVTRNVSTRLAWPIAAVLAIISIAGLVVPSMYARETPAWAAQAFGQDWFDLVVAAPWLLVCGWFAAGGSYRWRVLLAGAYAYVVYELVIYAFAVHFNAMFLIYCATLGLAAYALIALILELANNVEPIDRRAARLAGGALIAIGVVFAGLWLAEDVPALLRGTHPASLDDTGLITNPVHVMDLAFVLPAHILVGVWLWRRRERGELLAPIVLGFGVLMAASIGGMLIAIRLTGGDAPVPVIAVMLAIATGTGLILRRLLHVPAGPDSVQTRAHRAIA